MPDGPVVENTISSPGARIFQCGLVQVRQLGVFPDGSTIHRRKPYASADRIKASRIAPARCEPVASPCWSPWIISCGAKTGAKRLTPLIYPRPERSIEMTRFFRPVIRLLPRCEAGHGWPGRLAEDVDKRAACLSVLTFDALDHLRASAACAVRMRRPGSGR